jgi:hypothetical protein
VRGRRIAGEETAAATARKSRDDTATVPERRKRRHTTPGGRGQAAAVAEAPETWLRGCRDERRAVGVGEGFVMWMWTAHQVAWRRGANLMMGVFFF